MAGRDYNFKDLSQDDLAKLAEWYPDAVEIVRKPVYRQLSMLARCKARLPEGVSLDGCLPVEDNSQPEMSLSTPMTSNKGQK